MIQKSLIFEKQEFAQLLRVTVIDNGLFAMSQREFTCRPSGREVSNVACHLGFLSGSLPLSSKHNNLYLVSVHNALCHNNFWMFTVFSRFWNLPGHKTGNICAYVSTCAIQTSHQGRTSFHWCCFVKTDSHFKEGLIWRVSYSKILAFVGWFISEDLWDRAIKAGLFHPTWNNSPDHCSPETPVRVANLLSVSTAPLPLPLPNIVSFPCHRWC